MEIEEHLYGSRSLPLSNVVDSAVCNIRAKLKEHGDGSPDPHAAAPRLRALRGGAVRSIRRTLALAPVRRRARPPARRCRRSSTPVRRWLLTGQFDADAPDEARDLRHADREEGDDVELGFIEQTMPEYFTAAEPEYFELWLLDAPTVLLPLPVAGEGDLPRTFGTETAPLIWDLDLPDGRAGRAIGAEFVVHFYEPGEEDPGPAHVVARAGQGKGHARPRARDPPRSERSAGSCSSWARAS